MPKRTAFSLLVTALAVSWTGCGDAPLAGSDYRPEIDSLRFEGEVHLRNIRQLTFGGNNAEAYFSFDDKQLTFQSDFAGLHDQGCDQIFRMNVDGSPYEDGRRVQLVSTGSGRTTCSFFLPDGRILYASTHAAGPECPSFDMSAAGAYVWPLFDSYDIYVAQPDGSNPEVLIGGPGYDAEATVSPDGRYIVYTSTRSGDLELWRYEIATGDQLQLTDTPGYDGGAFFSGDSNRLVWRASRPEGEALQSYQTLLARGLIEPGQLNVFVANVDGSEARQVTDLPGANWAPFFHPDGRRILFASNHLSESGRGFDVFMINDDGSGLEQVTHSGTFDAFPMFSHDGKLLVFASNRNVKREPTRDTNIFVAEWIDMPDPVDMEFRWPMQ